MVVYQLQSTINVQLGGTQKRMLPLTMAEHDVKNTQIGVLSTG
jgi:hypothetical protein